jgi:hypothetical protein
MEPPVRQVPATLPRHVTHDADAATAQSCHVAGAVRSWLGARVDQRRENPGRAGLRGALLASRSAVSPAG